MSFKLDRSFVEKYKSKNPPFGFNGLGYITYLRTYSRLKTDGTKEMWYETIERVVNGCYNIQKQHINGYELGWDERKAQRSAQEMYDLMFNMKFLPGGRGLWAMGTPLVNQKGLSMALFNCASVTTENIDKDFTFPFRFLMDLSMIGVGVGIDTRGSGKLTIHKPNDMLEHFVVEDSREGWVESVGKLLSAYNGGNGVIFDYSKIRSSGIPLKGMGGISSGPQPLINLHTSLRKILDSYDSKSVNSRLIADIANLIGVCVVSGGIRRTAEVLFGESSDEDFLDLKDYNRNPEREMHGWSSNNTIFAKLGMNYADVAKRSVETGEPGFIWLENVQNFGRMGEIKTDSATLSNPCLEAMLESTETCNLTEIFLNNIDNKEELVRTIKFAFLYSKTVTLLKTHWMETNRVILRNRRIGCGVTGIAQFLGRENINVLREWLREGYDYLNYYDEVYSRWFGIPKSIRLSVVKPAGTTSILAGSTPGIHFPISRFYIRRMRLTKTDPLVQILRDSGYKVTSAYEEPEFTVVAEFPVDSGRGVRTQDSVSIWEQLSLVAFMQEHWADQSVSCTISFDPKTEKDQILPALNYYQYKLKTVSFLPRINGYQQQPYEAITEEKYNELTSNIRPVVNTSETKEDGVGTKYCEGDKCVVY